ncbi:hypothetical protein [Paenibacillus baekrokdamisoli]|nr:hypothetical protein [Paenibacillus baekrokdamisoli]
MSLEVTVDLKKVEGLNTENEKRAVIRTSMRLTAHFVMILPG